jgi:hypothetical protein
VQPLCGQDDVVVFNHGGIVIRFGVKLSPTASIFRQSAVW